MARQFDRIDGSVPPAGSFPEERRPALEPIEDRIELGLELLDAEPEHLDMPRVRDFFELEPFPIARRVHRDPVVAPR